MDQEIVGDNLPSTDWGCVMTTSHTDKPIEEALDFFRPTGLPRLRNTWRRALYRVPA